MTNCKIRGKKKVREKCKEINKISEQFDSYDIQKSINAIKNYKAVGLDDICTEQL